MRKDSKQYKSVEVRGIQNYHECNDYTDRQAYARQGFTREFRVYNSDRTIAPSASVKAFGTEIEITSEINNNDALGIIIEKVVFPIFPDGLLKQQYDGSLGGRSSSEIITQPMTKAFIRNHYNDFRAMWEFLNDINTRPDNSCGMHINISLANFGKTPEKQRNAIMRLHNYLADNYDFACGLFKRDMRYTTYCGRMRRDYLDTCGSHGLMCNYSHMNAGDASRVEIRLVGPQKTFQAFRNTFETMFFLVDAVRNGRNMTDPIKLWAGCNECVLDRLKDMVGNGLTLEQFEAIKAKSINEGIREATTPTRNRYR